MPYFLQVCRQVLLSIPWATEAVGRYITMSDSLHSARQHITYKICMVVGNCLNVSAPTYLQEISNSVSADENRLQLCSVDHGNVVMPRSNTDRFGRCGFSAFGPKQWNKLPLHIRKVSDNPEQFTRALTTFPFSNSTD